MATDPFFLGPRGLSYDSLGYSSTHGHPSDFTDYAPASMWRALQYDNNDGGYDDASQKVKEEAVRIDYSVLSVAVMTLGLIMVVELGRHKLDHAAHHKPFLKAVLEGVYEELATLGIVEFLLHLMAEYYEEYDKAKKHVFADVHFLLFYTAILNALQSLLLHFVARRVSERLWVQTEMLELNHYVEIREEFEKVKKELDQLHHRKSLPAASHSAQSSNSTNDDEDVDKQELGVGGKLKQRGPTETAEDAFALNQDCISDAIQSLMDRIRYPALKTKYNELLLQVRFHEMRVHFLQAYNLPLKLRIGDYLIRSEERVMLKLVHVSPLAWLLLTGVVNLAYYILGIVSYKVQDPSVIGQAFIWIFFCGTSLFVFLSWLVKNKMKAVFKTIMNSQTFWNVEHKDADQHGELAEQQRALFWGGDPKLVMAAIQSMQFGYAVAISTIIIFFEEINDGNVPVVSYFLAIAGCYSVFLVVIAQAIPRYTLCTSLGQLVNERHLHETLAAFHLEEARLRDLEDSDDERSRLAITKSVTSVPSIKSSGRSKLATGGSVGGDSSLSSSRHDRRSIRQESTNAAIMFELVRTKTDALRSQLPASEMARLQQRQKQKNRVKQFSDGVAAMSRMKSNVKNIRDDFVLTTNTSSADQVGDFPLPKSGDRRKRRKAMSEGVALMASTMRVHESSNDDDLVSQQSKWIPDSDLVVDDNDDNASVDTDCSGYSDANDVPEANRNLVLDELDGQHHMAFKISPRERLYEYFTSRRYVAISNIFGTMVAFFFVGQRIESFLHSEGIANERFTHFDFAHDYVFWLLAMWLMFFMMGAVLIMYTFKAFDSVKNNKDRQILLSGIFDLVICGTSLAIFFVAEGQRCCDTETTPQCSCPPFGRRLYGGLGRVEPYVSLFALRIFRFWLAKRIVLYIDAKGGWNTNTNQSLRNESIQLDPLDVFGKSAQHGHHCHDEARLISHGGHEQGDGAIAAELWENAVARHPEIVAEYGQFSGEILRAMLGLHVNCGPPHKTPTVVNDDRDMKETDLMVPVKITDAVETFSDSLPVESRHPVDTVGRFEFHTMGEKQKSLMIRKPSTVELMRTSSLSHLPAIASKMRTTPTDATFDSLFASPRARLVRSMRRCDRKFIPFLNKWSAVDVALTRFEMVYFDAVKVDEEVSLDVAGDAARQALMATKGGKGLRLCDVAAGRRVVGHLHFSEINSVHVERRMPRESAGSAVECSEVEVDKNEFWKHAAGRPNELKLKRGDEWSTIKQDCLKIITNHGHVLYLRFYSDLEDAQNHADRLLAEDECSGFLYKNNAFQWAQTIGRYRGPSQLKQTLPHFGDDTCEELRDFLIVDNGTRIQKGHRRVQSVGSDGAMYNFFGRLRLRVFEQIEV